MDVPACSGPGLGPASCRHSHGSPARGQRSHGHPTDGVQALHVQAQLRETRGGGRSASSPTRSSANPWCGRCSQPRVQSAVFSCAATSSPTAHPSARPQHPPSAHPELIHLLRGLGRRRPHFWGSRCHEHTLSHVSCRLCSGLVPGCFGGAQISAGGPVSSTGRKHCCHGVCLSPSPLCSVPYRFQLQSQGHQGWHSAQHRQAQRGVVVAASRQTWGSPGLGKENSHLEVLCRAGRSTHASDTAHVALTFVSLTSPSSSQAPSAPPDGGWCVCDPAVLPHALQHVPPARGPS